MSSTEIPSITTTVASPPCARAEFSQWCHSNGKRALDIFVSATLLAMTLPLLAVIAMLVWLSSPGPVVFRQRRAGLKGKEFELLKFRTMIHGATGPGITQAGDTRITRVGRWLRSCKLDELPQLWNVLCGEMSLVGPRPDLMEYWSCLSADQLRALELMPGITGEATLKFPHEDEYLKHIPRQDLTRFYCEDVLPRKIDLELEYARDAHLGTDLKTLARTTFALINKRSNSSRTL
jgi:lipopolysaccharide/colanic/teichoic acid biosynthesis glycosyltransferase